MEWSHEGRFNVRDFMLLANALRLKRVPVKQLFLSLCDGSFKVQDRKLV